MITRFIDATSDVFVVYLCDLELLFVTLNVKFTYNEKFIDWNYDEGLGQKNYETLVSEVGACIDFLVTFSSL